MIPLIDFGYRRIRKKVEMLAKLRDFGIVLPGRDANGWHYADVFLVVPSCGKLTPPIAGAVSIG